MATNFKDISEKVFNLLKGHGFDLRTFNKEGKMVIDPQEGTRFVSDEPNLIVRIDDMEKEISLQTSEDFADHNLRNLLKELAQDNLLTFDFRVFDKTIKAKGEEIDVARRKEIDMNEELNTLRKLSGLETVEENTKDNCTACDKDMADCKCELCKDCDAKGCEKCDDGKIVTEETLNENPYLAGVRLLGQIFKQGAKRPITTTIAVDAVDGELDTTQGAISWLGKAVGNAFTPDAIKKAGPIIVKYGIPVAGVMAAIYGGKKLADFVAGKKDQGLSVSQNNQTLNASISEMKYVNTPVGKLPVKDNGGMLDFSEYMDWEKSTGEQKPNRASQRWPGYQQDYKQYVQTESMDLDRPSLDQDLPANYFKKLASVRKTIYAKYGNNDKVNSVVSKLNDEEKTKGAKADPNNIMMKVMKHLGKSITEASLGKMTGSRKSSYQPLADNVKIIVRHNKEVNEEVRGARSRNIHSILIQRGEEKFKMAENNLSAARAMARHLHNGGETFDEIGEAITEMSREFKKLKEFVNYVRRSNLVNETNEEFVTMALENINDIKTNLKRLSGVKSYANAVESVLNYNNVEMLQDDLDLESKFTETHFDEKVANVMDSLKAMASRKQSFENKIVKAIESETFANIKDLLSENDIIDFDTPHGKLGHQVSQLGYSAQDSTLSNYLHGISNKISAGGQLNQFEYGTIKSCLLSAGQHNVQNAPMSVEESYEAFMDSFIEESPANLQGIFNELRIDDNTHITDGNKELTPADVGPGYWVCAYDRDGTCFEMYTVGREEAKDRITDDGRYKLSDAEITDFNGARYYWNENMADSGVLHIQ
jgi:hypothetical protein